MPESDFAPFAYDDDLIAAAQHDRQSRVRVYRLAAPVVVLGSGSRADIEVNLDACRVDGLPVLRRRGGGCAVVLDPGNVIVSTVATGLPFGGHRRYFDQITNWLIEGLSQIGFRGIFQNGICDLVLGDRKIGGACIYRKRDLLYYSVSLLVDPDLDCITRYLKHPPREPEYRRGRNHAEFMGVLVERAAGANTTARAWRRSAADVATSLRRVLTIPNCRLAEYEHDSRVCHQPAPEYPS